MYIRRFKNRKINTNQYYIRYYVNIELGKLVCVETIYYTLNLTY